MMTSDFMPVKSGNCSMNFGLSPVRMPASPDCIAAAAPEVTMAPYPSGSLSISAMRLPPAADGNAKALRPLKIVPTSAPSEPRNVLRFQRSLNAIVLRPLLYVAHHRSDAINFHQRLAWQARHPNGGASGPSVRKVSLEHRVHAVVIVQLCQKHGELKNAVHGAAARFNGSLHAFHHHVGVHLDGRSFAGVGLVAA